MLKLKNNTSRVICVEDKDIIPGTAGVKFQDDILNHPRVKKLVDKGDLEVVKAESAKKDAGKAGAKNEGGNDPGGNESGGKEQ